MNEESSSSSSLPYEIINKKVLVRDTLQWKELRHLLQQKNKVVSALEALNLQATFYESKAMSNGGRKYRLSYAYSI